MPPVRTRLHPDTTRGGGQGGRRFPGAVPSLPPLHEWVDVIHCDDDLGPATKVLPAAARWRGTETDLLL
ncbi:MAG: hypothetical protein ACOVME_13030, partial [Rhodobacter sp.]